MAAILKIAVSKQRFDQSPWNFARWRILALLTPSAISYDVCTRIGKHACNFNYLIESVKVTGIHIYNIMW